MRAPRSSRSSRRYANTAPKYPRASKYYHACSELEKIAKHNGYVKCKRFFNTGRCSFADSQQGCRHFPCKPEYSTRDGAVRVLLDSIK